MALDVVLGFAHALNWLALACALISGGAVAWMVLQSTPAAVEKRLRDAERISVEAHTRVGELTTRYVAFLEDADRILMAVERKRASISTAESKANAREARAVQAGEFGPQPGASREELRSWAASKGYLS